jgi:serine/threonine-protein kinase RsbW
MVERRFPRAVASLDAIFEFVDEFLAESGLDPACGYDLELVLEELFTNQVKYTRGTRPIRIALDTIDSKIRAVLQDEDVEPFDPTQARPVRTDAPIEERKPGGLGIHMVRKLTEEFRYDYRDRTSTITLTMRSSP